MAFIRTADLCKTYGSGENLVRAVHKVSLEIEKGDMIAIVGKSGSGKTTLLHLLSGLDKPTSGRILYENARLDLNSEKALAKYRAAMWDLCYSFSIFCLFCP